MGFSVAEVHHGRSRRGEVRSSHAEAGGADAAAILNHSARGLGLRPLPGIGTTLAAAELTGRLCYGLELDPKYVDVVVQRWQGLSGTGRLDGDGRNFDEIAGERLKRAAYSYGLSFRERSASGE